MSLVTTKATYRATVERRNATGTRRPRPPSGGAAWRPSVIEHGLAAEQGGQVRRGGAGGPVEAAGGEPAADVLRVAGEVPGALRVGDHVDHLGQVDHDQPPVVHQQVVRGQ